MVVEASKPVFATGFLRDLGAPTTASSLERGSRFGALMVRVGHHRGGRTGVRGWW